MKYNRKLADYVDKNYDIRDLYEQVTGRKPGTGKCMCPFHHNVNTPAAKIYGNTLKCFGVCNKLYSVFDFLNTFFPQELEHISRSVILPEVTTKESKFSIIPRDKLDLNQPLSVIYKRIIEHEENKPSIS